MIFRKDDLEVISFIKKLPKKIKFLIFGTGLLVGAKFGIEFCIPITLKNFIDSSIHQNSIFNYYLVSLVIYYALAFVSNLMLGVLTSITELRIKNFLFIDTFRKIFNLKKNTILKKGAAYYYDIISMDCNTVTEFFQPKLFYFVFSLLQAALILLLMYSWNTYLFINLSITYLLSIVISIIFFRGRKKYFSLMRRSSSALVRETSDIFANNFSIKIFGMYNKFKEIINQQLNIVLNHKKNFFIVYIICENALFFLKSTSFFFIIFTLLNSMINKKMSYGQMVATISYFQFFFKPIDYFLELLGKIAQTETSVKRLLSLKDEQLKIDPIQNIKLFERIEKIRFENISFFYSGKNEKRIYENIDFEITRNDRLGVVGLSGEGKTSLLKLIYKENKPISGRILINGKYDIQDIPTSRYYERLNILSQSLEIYDKNLDFNLTLGRNVTNIAKKNIIMLQYTRKIQELIRQLNELEISQKDFLKELSYQDIDLSAFFTYTGIDRMFIHGKANASKSHNKRHFENKILNNSFVENIVKYIYAHNHIDADTYDEVRELLNLKKLSNRGFGEGGAFISGGEKQKVAFGRFLLKADHDFFILDEPFTNLDAISENQLIAIAEKKLKEKMGLIISHKFNIIQRIANKIIVLEKGKIVEEGEHKYLVQKDGLYKKLYEKFIQQR